jgi:hypothetical protein
MKINDGRITILTSEKEVTIELRDSEASIIFAKITMTAEQFTHALSRVANKKVESMEVFNLDKVGKKWSIEF